MPIVIGLGDTAWNDPLNIFGGKPPAPEPPKPVAETEKPRFTLTDQDRQDLRKTIAAEAAGEGETGMIAVGNVIRNRAERRGKSLADVVREPNQFTGYEAPGPDALQILQDPDQVAKIDSIIDRMAAGELPDITGGADHYHASYVSPDWAGKMPKTAEVGQHLFYRAENGPDTKRKPMPTYNDLAGQIGLDGDPFEAVLKGETSPASDRKPKGRGMGDLLPDEPEPMKGNGGALAFVNPGQDKIEPEFRSMLEGASQDLGRGLTVLSGFRAPTHAVEAAKNKPGEHSHGTASDISMKGMNEQERATLVQSLLARGAKRFITYSNSPDMLHVDMKDQLGDGTPWFMHDKSNRNLSRAPGWFQEIAKNPTPAQKAIEAQAPAGAGATAAPAATGNTIVIDEGFAASDPMGLLAGESPFAGIVDQAKAAKAAEQEQVGNQFEQNRITGLNQIANRETEARRAALEAQSPGRYVEIDAAELPEFQKKWEEENRSEGVLGDTGRILKSGVIGVGQSLTSLADTIFSNVPGGKEFLKASDDIDRWLLGETLDQRMDTAKARTNASVTPEQAEADVKNWWDSDRGTFGPAWRDPRSYLRTVGESVPATVVTMAPGGMLARGAYLRTLAATGSERAAAAAAARTATVAGALLEGTMGGADTARVVRDRIGAIPRDQLLETDTVKALVEGGLSEDQAIAALTDDASTKAFAIAGVATGMFGGMGDRALAKILAEGVGGGIAQRMLTGAARGMVAEGLLEEAPQGAAQTIAGNIGVRDANPEQDLTEGMGEAVASGIAAGGVMGGGMGAAGGAASPPSSGAASVDESVADPPAAAAPTPTAAPEPRGPIGRSVKHAEDQIAQRQAANPTPSPVTSPQPSADGRPAAGATVTVSADGIEPFMGTVQSYEGDEAVVSTADGELFQVPLGTLSVNAPPVQTIPDRGPQPINDTIPEFSTDPALEPMPPAAAEVTSEGLPPRSEQKDATERFPSAPTPGQRVIVDDENGGRFAATVQSYENNSTEALVRTDDGKDLQVPVSSLKVSKLTPKQVEAQDLKRNPPVEREVGDAGPTSRTVLGKTIVLPDDKHARLFDLGKERQAQKRVMGTSALDLDRVDPRELKALAQEFGISEQGVGQLADDYATRMVRNVRSANSKLPQRMPPVMDTILARWRRDAVDAEAEAVPAADETQAWYDRELDDEGRRLAMISANIKRPPKTPWADLSPAMQRKLAVVRSEQQAAAATPADVDSTEANSVESKDQTPTVSVDVAANEAATSPTNDRPEPTPAQKEAGNYKVGRISLGGLDISIENPAGSERKGTDKNGKAWSIQMKSHYGYIRGTVGRDKDHIDVFVKPGTETLDAASPVFIVDQENADGSFDEHKVMLGYGSQDEAEKAYLENYTKGWKIGPVTATPLSGFKDWLKRGYTDEPASIEINEVFWNPPPADNDFLDEFGEGRRPPETKEQIYDDLATRISVPKFVERLATDKGGMGAAFIEPSGKLYLIRGTDNQNGDHAEFFGRMFANNHITGRDDGYVRISSYSDYFGYSTGGDISQAAAATIKALETAAARAGINVIKPANDFKVVGEAPADVQSQASATPKPKSLTEFLAERGGVQDQGGDLRVAGIRAGKESFVPGAGSLIRANGMTLDHARKLAVEAGYLTDAGATSNRPSESYISDLVDAIAEDVRSGRQLFSKADAAQAARWLEEQQIKQDLDRYGSEEEFRSQQAMEAALDEVTALTGRERTDVFATDIAAVMVQKGVDFDTAAIEVDRRYEEQALAAARDAKPQIVGALGDIPFFDEDGGAASAARTVNDGNIAGRTETPTDAGTVLEGSSRAGSAGSQGERSEAQRGSERGVSGVPESGRVQENDGRRQQKARQPELAPGRSTTRTVAGKSVVFPDEYHAEIFDLGMNLLKDNGLSPADITAGTSIDEVVPENFRVLGPRREEAQRLASTIGTYMDPTILSADEMGLAAMEIAVMETEVAVSKRSDASIRASSVIDVDAQQEWTQAILDEVRLGTPVQPRSEGELAPRSLDETPVSAEQAATVEPEVLQPRENKQPDPEMMLEPDANFRRIPVPARAAETAILDWAKNLVLEKGRKAGNEVMLAIDDDGSVVEFGTSDKPKFVGVNAALSRAMANPDRRIVVFHNHPRNYPLSTADLVMLLNPGMHSIWAIGHDGLENRAALTDRAVAAMKVGNTRDDVANSMNRFEKALNNVRDGIHAILDGNVQDRAINVSEAEAAHFTGILEAVRRAGIIDFTTNQPYDHSNIPMLDRAIDNAALKLARTLLDERATPQTSDARVLRSTVSVQHVAELGRVAENRSDVEGRNEGQSGLREGSPRDYQAEAQGRSARRLTASRRISENSIVEAISGKWTDLNPSLLATVPLNYFVELARPNMTAVKEYMSVKRLMDAYRGDKHAEADAIAGEWLKYMRLGFGQSNKAKAQELADLMHESTLAGIDPSQTDEETRAKAGYDILRKRYQALPAKGKELFAKVRDAYRAQADELDQILLDNVRKSQKIAKDQAEARYRKKLEEIRADRSMNPLDRRKAEEDAASRYKAESTKMDWSAKARLTKLRVQFESNRVPAPYFPLGRFGQYFVTAKDVDGSVISFSKFERAADRDRFARDIQRDYPGATVTKGVMKDMTDPRAAMDPRMVAEIEQLLGNAGVDQDLMDMVYQRYLETLPELSMRKRYMHRKGTAGYDTDALRVFSSHMFHAAHQMAKLKYGLELQELVNTTFDQAEAADDQTRAMRLANEMASRHKWVMNPTGGSLAQTMTSTAFVWFLAASPAAAVLNLTQTFMMGLPILGARFGGITRAGVEVAKASADLISGKGSVRNANLSREEMAAVDAFYRSGMIDRTQSHDLAGVGDTGVRYSPLRARVMGVMSWAFHNTEVWNREATALAAYRLARKAGQSHLAAIDSAHDLTWKTHFDYANSSRPRIMQNDFAKVALVFRSYSINMLYRLFRDIHQSVKGESPQARREARYQLAGVTGMMALMSGVTGVFGFNMMMAIAGMVFGDDDDPMDFDERFKADVLDILGPELGGVVLKGVPGHYLGVDLTSRIGMPDLWFRSPGQDLQGKEEWNYWISQVLGATAGIGEQWFRGASLIMEGDVARGVEVMAPKFIRDPMKAFRYANEGLQSIKGDELLSADQIGIHGAVAQAMGVSPAIVSETWDRSGALKNAERRVMDERQRVVNAWAMAALAGDKEGVAEAIERVKVFNKKPIHSAIPITQDTLKRSIKTRVRNAAKREDGVLIQNEILSQRLRAAMPERLY